jgi:hypothetical protein
MDEKVYWPLIGVALGADVSREFHYEGTKGVKLDKRRFSPTLPSCSVILDSIIPAPFITAFFAAIAARTSSSMRVTERGFSYCSRKASSVSGIITKKTVRLWAVFFT